MRKKPMTSYERIMRIKRTIKDYKKAKGEYLKFIPELEKELKEQTKEYEDTFIINNTREDKN